jgi:hypothetical protein
MEDVLGGIANVAAGNEPLDAVNVPGAIRLRDGLGARGPDIGTRVRFGEHHRGRPPTLQAHRRPLPLLFGALEVERVGQRRAQAAEEARRRVRAVNHLVDPPRERWRRGDPADRLGDADAPPFGVLHRLYGFGQFGGHADGMTVGVKYRRIAVRVRKRLGQRTVGKVSDLVEHRARGVDVEITIAARAESAGEVEHLE